METAIAPRIADWMRDFYFLWVGLFLNTVSTSMLLPVLSLYLNQLGVSEGKDLANWTGITFSVTFLIAAVAAPVWCVLQVENAQLCSQNCLSTCQPFETTKESYPLPV